VLGTKKNPRCVAVPKKTQGKKMNAKMIRQGDVLLVPISDTNQLPIPLGGSKPMPIKPKAGRIVLARGGTSLHEHTLVETDADLVCVSERMLLNLYRATRLVVTDTLTGTVLPRHTPIELPGGLYEVRIQRALVQQQGRMFTRRVAD
jgi:hypothetical protein